MRSLILALAALAFATAASADDHKPVHAPYTRDSDGKCRGPTGAIVPLRLCHVEAHCKDPKTHKSVSCKTPGAVETD